MKLDILESKDSKRVATSLRIAVFCSTSLENGEFGVFCEKTKNYFLTFQKNFNKILIILGDLLIG